MTDATATLLPSSFGWIGRFRAMASPCELLLEPCAKTLAWQLLQAAEAQARRIEQKYSRYLPSSVLSQLNQGAGRWQPIDPETFQLLSFAQQCYVLSDGLFDISSGLLRNVWRFDGSDQLPSVEAVAALLPHIGWQQIQLEPTQVLIPQGMELDLGGIAKEYAVDKVGQLLQQMTEQHHPNLHLVVNFGGDMLAIRERPADHPWRIGIEHPGLVDHAAMQVALRVGALATSGDARRFLQKDGIRYSHILNPKTGWPVTNAPRSVTVAAPHCTLAGLIATTALLHGADAEHFLQAQGLPYWLIPA